MIITVIMYVGRSCDKYFMVVGASLVAGIHSFAKPFVKSAVSNIFVYVSKCFVRVSL